MELLRPIWSVGKQLLDRPSNREWLEQYSAAKDVVDPWAHRRSSLIKNRDDLANVCATISEIVRRSSHSQQVFSLAQGPQVNLVTATGLWICGEPATSFSSCGSGEWINKCSSTGSRELAPNCQTPLRIAQVSGTVKGLGGFELEGVEGLLGGFAPLVPLAAAVIGEAPRFGVAFAVVVADAVAQRLGRDVGLGAVLGVVDLALLVDDGVAFVSHVREHPHDVVAVVVDGVGEVEAAAAALGTGHDEHVRESVAVQPEERAGAFGLPLLAQ
ncbi:hypothetical protein GQR58_030097 [Nymphon striatum]|nr:hypothetical protein GQR58_030097 [Nymphon striatum]